MSRIDKRIKEATGRKPSAYLRECIRRHRSAHQIAREIGGVSVPTVTRRLRMLGYEPNPLRWRRIPRQRRDATNNTTTNETVQISAGGVCGRPPATNPEVRR